MLEKQWSGLVWPASKEAVRDPDTGVNEEALVRIGNASVNVPEGFVSLLAETIRVRKLTKTWVYRKSTPGCTATSSLVYKVWRLGRIWTGPLLR